MDALAARNSLKINEKSRGMWLAMTAIRRFSLEPVFE
jgi:hypothetical protein